MTETDTSPTPPARPAGYPLGALFVLVATSAVLAVAIAPLVRELGKGDIEGWWLATTLIVGSGAGLLLGGFLGLLSFRGPLGIVVGIPIGLVLGLIAGVIVHVKQQHLPRVALAMLVGSVAVVIIAFWMRKRE